MTTPGSDPANQGRTRTALIVFLVGMLLILWAIGTHIYRTHLTQRSEVNPMIPPADVTKKIPRQESSEETKAIEADWETPLSSDQAEWPAINNDNAVDSPDENSREGTDSEQSVEGAPEKPQAKMPTGDDRYDDEEGLINLGDTDAGRERSRLLLTAKPSGRPEKAQAAYYGGIILIFGLCLLMIGILVSYLAIRASRRFRGATAPQKNKPSLEDVWANHKITELFSDRDILEENDSDSEERNRGRPSS